jgi:diguanylate cyclase (GGDEF)-like protein
LKLPVDDDFAGDPGLQRGYGQRAQAAWSVPGRGTSPPIRGVGPDLLTGLPGFARNDADLPADLVLARRFSEIIGAIVAVDPMSVRAVYVSSNGLLAAVPDLPDKDTAALLRLVAGRPYFQAALAGKDVTDGLTWGAPLPEGDATRPSVGLALPLTTDGRVRGIIALFMLQQYLLDAAVQADSPEPPAPGFVLIDRQGATLASTDARFSRSGKPVFPAEIRAQILPTRSTAGAGSVRAGDGSFLIYSWVGDDWLLLKAVSRGQLYLDLLRSQSPLLPLSAALAVTLVAVMLRLGGRLRRLERAEHGRLRGLAERDPLTGLANRRAFAAAFAVAERQRDGRPLALVVLDIDRFKQINDRFGHAGGDAVLKMLAAVCRSAAGPGGTVGRLGGEEFGILLPAATLAEATLVAERLRIALAACACPPVGPAGAAEIPSEPIRFTASFGVAEATADAAAGLDELLAVADRRLYRAKETGRDRVVAGDPPAAEVTGADTRPSQP